MNLSVKAQDLLSKHGVAKTTDDLGHPHISIINNQISVFAGGTNDTSHFSHEDPSKQFSNLST